jgi:hypothetical protein
MISIDILKMIRGKMKAFMIDLNLKLQLYQAIP